jgi:Tim44-like domain
MSGASRSIWRRLPAVAVCLMLMHAGIALARPGGGHTFSGSSSSHFSGSSSHFSGSSHYGGSSSGGGGGGELVFMLIRLVFFYPWFSVPVLVVVVMLWMRAQRAQPGSWDTSGAAPRPRVDLSRLQALDPEFSRVVLEDFAYRLYASAHRARHDARASAGLAPYLSDEIRAELAAESPAGVPVSNVVVGALGLTDLTLSDTEVELTLDYTANLTLGAAANMQTLYQRERWVMRRATSARTKPPEETERLGCPNCGAPFQSSDGRRCAYCDKVVADGRFAWQVVRRTLLEREPRPPALTSTVAEQGTDLPTVVDDANDSAWQALCARDPNVAQAGIEARTAHIYATLNVAWSALDLSSVRGVVSDGMFDYLRYWTEAYAAQGLRNMLEQMNIQRMERVKVLLDPHFDAITVRLWASGLDYTVDAKTGALVSGSRNQAREYSEYWTLIRGASVRGQAHSDANCPSCAAPLRVSMAGTCEHCGTHVTRGEFDWVLSKIEQDDVYAG